MAINMADNGSFGLSLLDLRAPLYPDKAFPVDARSLFYSYEQACAAAREAKNAGSNENYYYFGQQICVVTEKSVRWYVIGIDKDKDNTGVPVGVLVPLSTPPMFSSYKDASDAALGAVQFGEKGAYYFGQQVCVVTETSVDWYIIDRGENEAGEPVGVLVPLGAAPHIGENGNWFIGDYDTDVAAQGPKGDEGEQGPAGRDGFAIPIDGFFTMGVEGETLYAYPSGTGAIPDLRYDSASGELSYWTDEAKKTVIGKVRGPQGIQGPAGTTPHIGENGNWFIGTLDLQVKAQGPKGDTGKATDVNLEEGSAGNALQQIGNTAGAKAFKITGAEKDKLVNGQGLYTLQNASGIEPGMKYVACTSEMNAIGGEIVSVEGNIVTVNGYLAVGLNTLTDNAETGDIYNYLIIVGNPKDPNFVPGSIGDVEIGYGAVSFGDGSVVYAKNGFSSAKNGKVLGKYGKVGGIETEAGHGARADGIGSKALGTASSTDGNGTKATGYASHASGVGSQATGYGAHASGLGTKATKDGQHAVGKYNDLVSDDDMFIVGAGDSDSDRRNCFAAGRSAQPTGTYIRVADQQVTAYHLKVMKAALAGFTHEDTAVKKSDISAMIASAFVSNVTIEDGAVYYNTED